MPCENATISCRTVNVSTHVTSIVINATTATPTTAAQDGVTGRASLRDDPVTLDETEVVVTMCLSVLTIVCNVLVLFLTKFAGGGQSPTMVFVRMLCVSDFFVGCFGLGKMVMFLFVDGLIINFFLPECLFFTATTAACLSLLLLSIDRSVKIVSPFWYAQNMDKQSIITGMVFLWNVSFVLGFLPLLGWNSGGGGYLYGFFAFLPWHYLLAMGLVWFACMGGSVAILLVVRRRVYVAQNGPAHVAYHLTEVERYKQLRVTVAVDVATWSLCYLPYLAFWGLACRVCPLGGQSGLEEDRVVYHFVPAFLLRSLTGAGVQLYRTAHVQGFAKGRRGSGSGGSPSRRRRRHHHRSRHRHHHHHHHRHSHHRQNKRSAWDMEEEEEVATISYSNPLWENSVTDFSSLEESMSLTVPSLMLHDPGVGACANGGDFGSGGISNPAYRPSIQIDFGSQGILGVTEEITAL